ncbi:unnamed protein product [Eruca vesicaria subsp. sativa]|uniref:Uncharacterized protein n=1 Tax=Eruca vesicaria subsp. sativa TaxID=29727 RepID=A0ABC8JP84_ERUVS|nr:unnamed protein product [Eruca vesicaria subsp. sativa]
MKYCVLLDIKEKTLKKLSKQQVAPLCDLEQALRLRLVVHSERFAFVDCGTPWRESMSREEFQIIQVHEIYQDDIILHHLARKFREESNSIILSTKGKLNKLKTLAIVSK